MELQELIERLEKATGPDFYRDFDLNNEIARFHGWTQPETNGGYWLKDGMHWSFNAPDYTSNLDAALTLVPDGFMYAIAGPWQYSEHHHNKGLCGKPISWAAVSDELYGVDVESLDDFEHSGKGSTPAIALCIAALKARASEGRGK